jgi:hypothetical protein
MPLHLPESWNLVAVIFEQPQKFSPALFIFILTAQHRDYQWPSFNPKKQKPVGF